MMRSKSMIPMLALLALFASLDHALAQTTADPTWLPHANRQLPNWDWYTGQGILDADANTPYFDPATGVRVTKITSATFPLPNASMNVDYSEGGPFISREW